MLNCNLISCRRSSIIIQLLNCRLILQCRTLLRGTQFETVAVRQQKRVRLFSMYAVAVVVAIVWFVAFVHILLRL